MTDATAKELVLAAKDAAVMLSAALKVAGVNKTDSPGFMKLMDAIRKAESELMP